ncbi:MAG: beta-N-acetylglucosaminidase domain-containing protein [Muribaculaceae bacterium]|nr:beta-N-acetylglucosaminidase domain-containing protein [Muribaculaceae bacterium]
MMKLIATMMMLLVGAAMSASTSYEIYPIPHSLTALPSSATFTRQVTLVADGGIDAATVARAREVLTEHGLLVAEGADVPVSGSCVMLYTAGGAGSRLLAAQGIDEAVLTQAGKYDRHILSLTATAQGAAQVVVVGEHTGAVFCGLASLEQMLDQRRAGGAMPCAVIHDYADVQNRGIVEGYYGVPYSAAVTKDLFRFMARYKMNTYIYGAKSDAYHSRYWSDPYPATITVEQERLGMLSAPMMRDIATAATAAKVNLVWAIHPGKAFADPDDKEVLDRIMRKLASMHELGVRRFGVFVDDVGVPSDRAVLELCATNLATLQQRIDARWNTPGTNPADTVRPLFYVPQLYAHGWVEQAQASAFYESLRSVPDKVEIGITGRNVWSVPNNGDLTLVGGWLQREPGWWWNYPCNDQDPTKLFIMDTYTNFRDETHILSLDRLERELHGTHTVVVNPMQQGELSKVALFSVADYTWNNRAFNNEPSWEAALPAVAGRYAEALRCVAPLLRYYDGDALDYHIVRYKHSVERGTPTPGALIALLTEAHNACRQLEELRLSPSESDRLLYDDLRPWLLRLRDMTAEAVALLNGNTPETSSADSNEDYQFNILAGMGNEIHLEKRTAQPAAQSLAPFIAWLRQRE